MLDGKLPGDQRAPIVRDQQAAPGAQRVEDGSGVGHQVLHPVGAPTERAGGAAVAAQVGCDGVPAALCQEGKLVAPGEAAFGEAVQAEGDVWTAAGFVDGEVQGGCGQHSQGKQFLFEKKNQETFVPWVTVCGTVPDSRDKSFLFLFFKKEILAYLLSQPPNRASSLSPLSAQNPSSIASEPC